PRSPANAGRLPKVVWPNGERERRGESDGCVVPAKRPNKAGSNPVAEVVEGGHPAKENALQVAAPRAQDRRCALNALWRVREAAIRDRKMKFTSLLHYVDEALLRSSYLALN